VKRVSEYVIFETTEKPVNSVLAVRLVTIE
jgi:hypothetical protein